MSNKPKFRALVTGSRDWTGWEILAALNDVRATAEAEGRELVVVHGACPTGADAFADTWIRTTGVLFERWPAHWRPNGIYNPQAGILRNAKMVGLGADVCLAFIRNGSRGATHCAGLSEAAGIQTVRYTA